MTARALHLGLVAVVSTLAAAAHAQPAELGDTDIHRAKAMFARGEAAERAGRWAEAIEALREVARIKSTAGVVFHIANCEEHLGQLAEALADFQLAEQLAETQGARDVERLVAPRLAALEKRVPRLALDVDPPDVEAELLVDGVVVPKSRWATAVRVSPGEREVVARVGGRDAFRTSVHLAEGASERVRVDVRAAAAPAVAPAPPPPPTSAPRRPAAAPPREAAPPSRGGPPVATIVLGGVAVAMAGAGVGTFVAAGAKNDAGRDACATPSTCDPGARDAVRALDAASLALWIGAGAAATAGVVLWATDARPSTPRAAVAVAPGGVALSGRF